jgi:hypothetical protein
MSSLGCFRRSPLFQIEASELMHEAHPDLGLVEVVEEPHTYSMPFNHRSINTIIFSQS